MINHIVLSGGAYLGLYELGCLKYLSKSNFYSIQNIKSIHGTSIGGFIGAILCLQMDWDILCDYFIERPWYKTASITPTMLFDVIQKKGLYNSSVIYKAIEPLFKSCDIDVNITLAQLHEKTNIDLYLYTIPISSFKILSLSHYSHPDLPLMKAIQMTCALPYIFQPVEYNDEFYIDGGLLNNYPLNDCFSREDASKDNILSLKFDKKSVKNTFNKDANILEYGYFLYKQMLHVYKNKKQYVNIENEVVIHCNEMNFNDGYAAIMNQDERKKYIEQGEVFAKMFLTYKNSNKIQKEDCNENSS